jgi:hypothetical protein
MSSGGYGQPVSAPTTLVRQQPRGAGSGCEIEFNCQHRLKPARLLPGWQMSSPHSMLTPTFQTRIEPVATS